MLPFEIDFYVTQYIALEIHQFTVCINNLVLFITKLYSIVWKYQLVYPLASFKHVYIVPSVVAVTNKTAVSVYTCMVFLH